MSTKYFLVTDELKCHNLCSKYPHFTFTHAPASTLYSQTRKLCYHKDDRAMRAIYNTIQYNIRLIKS